MNGDGNDNTALVERPGPTDPLSLIAEAVRRGVGAAELAGFFALQERRERNEAEGAFAKAITAFQNEMPAVHKGRSVQSRYNFASFDDIMKVAGPILRKYGIVVTFDSAPMIEGALPVTCKVRVGIHMEPTTVAVPPPEGNKAVNASQLMAQTLSYGKRYALCAALNIVTTDEDTDANYTAPEKPKANGEAANVIKGLWSEYEKLVPKKQADQDWINFIGWATGSKTGIIEEIPANLQKEAENQLRNWIREAGGK